MLVQLEKIMGIMENFQGIIGHAMESLQRKKVYVTILMHFDVTFN